MISIVFCSKDPQAGYIEHLSNSCGVRDVEVIPIKNVGYNSLVESYNRGLKLAKYDTVVFTHDDVAFNTQPWGYKILKHFDKNEEYGIIGLAGTDFLENGTWWYRKDNLYGRVFHQSNGKRWLSEYSKPNGNKLVEVVAVDGVFMAVRKDRIKKEFNLSYDGFHFYDIPFCVDNHLEGVKVGVCTNIDLTHFSIGETDARWRESRVLFESMYSDSLPIKIKRNIVLPKDKKIRYSSKPKVSIIIPTKDKLELLFPCLSSIYKMTSYDNYEVIIADTGSTEENKKKIKEFVSINQNTKIMEFDYYHFSKINNEVVKSLDSPELLVFCNNDIELINDVISRMVQFYHSRKHVGTLGCRLHYEDNTIQHNGIQLCVKNSDNGIYATHIDGGKSSGYTITNSQVIGNTAAFMMISYDKFVECGMYNEDYRHCFEDVELSLETIIKGYKNYVLSEGVAYHKESQTRDVKDTAKEMQEDFLKILVKKLADNIGLFKKYLILVP